MRLLHVLRNKKYLALAIISAILMAIIYPLIQVQATGGVSNLDVWFAVITPLNLILVIIFAMLFGIFLSFQIFNLRSKVCSVSSKTTSSLGGGFATLLSIAVPACPACLSIATLLLPASLGIAVAGFFLRYSSLLLALSIAILLLGVYLLGGFRKD